LFSRFLAVVTVGVLTTLIATPSYSDDVTINLDQTTPYVDIPVTITEPVDATISTVTGTPQTNTGFIDSWIELWQGTVRLAVNDDGAHSAINVLASIITIPLTAGEYFIRATSFNYVASNGTSFPVGSYLLSTNLIVATPTPTPSPTVIEPTPEPTPSPTETETPSPTPTQSSFSPTPEPTPEPSSPSPSPTDTPQPTESPTVPVGPTQEPNVPDPVPSEEFLQPSELPSPDVQDTLEEVVDESSNDFPSSFENELPSLENLTEEPLSPSATDEILELLEFLPELSLENLQETFQEISETITAALSTVSNLGSEFTPEEREQAQQVVLAAVIVTQLAAPRRMK
jgi:hypothetical protein